MRNKLPSLKRKPGSNRNQSNHPFVSIISAALNEEQNLPVLYGRLLSHLDSLRVDWELIIVDDHSTDNTFKIASDLATKDGRVRVYRFSKNSGSHLAIAYGVEQARGDCAIVMAADLQDSPELISGLLSQWKDGAQTVWAVREKREGEKKYTFGFARIYYFIMRHIVGLSHMHPTGADFFLIDRVVMDSVRQCQENRLNLLAIISWMGFRQTSIYYTKNPRLFGRSGWTLEKKIRLVIDSILSFSFFPVRWMMALGISISLAGIALTVSLLSLVILRHQNPEGWLWLVALISAVGGAQMFMLGLVGEYLWRSLEQSRQRPRIFVESAQSVDILEKKYPRKISNLM